MTSVINFKIDEEAKHVFEQTCANLGLSVSAALSIYVHKVINEKEIPFKISKVDYEKMHAKAMHDLKIWRQLGGCLSDFAKDAGFNSIDDINAAIKEERRKTE